MKELVYHSLSIKEVLQALGSSATGLTQKEIKSRQKKFGANLFFRDQKNSPIKHFILQFKNPLIYILFVALIISLVTKHSIDAWVILAVILVSSIIGFVQEYKASQALSLLNKMVRYKAGLLRDGSETVIDHEDIVPGDIILLSAGDRVPADARLIEVNNLEVIESALTGESSPSVKKIDSLEEGRPLADRDNMVYLGTVVAKGRAKAVVVATGKKTEIGLLASLVLNTQTDKTPLQKQLDKFGKSIGVLLIGANILIFGFGVASGKPIFEMFLTSVAVVVAAVPEGLLPAMTVILAIGMQRLARRQGLVRKMLAAETLGSVSVLCLDKTGTLTKGEMRISEVVCETDRLIVEDGKFSHTISADSITSYATALKIGLLCNNAVVENPGAKYEELIVKGDPTEKALMLAGIAAGMKKDDLEEEKPRIAEIPFDSEYKYMATLHNDSDKPHIYVKGILEKIIDMSSYLDVDGQVSKLTPDKKKKIQKEYEKLASQGLRVLAVAYKVDQKLTKEWLLDRKDLHGLTFVGMLAFKDPLRSEVKETLDTCIKAGIRPIILTGDHKLTAMSIVQDAGIEVVDENVIDGSEIDSFDDATLQNLVNKVTIFARVEPKHKIRIVSLLQANGEVVAMTGDGVNDAPALKKADIGIAMGSGTDVAKDTADLVLMDNSFKTITEAVRRGRITFNNIRKVILYLLTDSFSEMVIVGGSVLLGLPLPVLPAQILWIKLIEDAAPAMSLALDEIDEDVMREKPRKKDMPLLGNVLRKLVVFYALIMDFTLFVMFDYFWQTSNDIVYARTITFVGLGLSSLFYIYAVRGLKFSIFKLNPFSNLYLIATTITGVLLFFVALYVPFFNNVLHTIPLGVFEWTVLGGYSVLGIVVYEIGKKMFASNKDIG